MHGNPPGFKLRRARAADYEFAKRLHFDTLRPLLTKLATWDQTRSAASFEQSFKLDEVRVITVNGADAGWLQVSETEADIHLLQIHVVPAFQSRGIGTQLIQDLLVRGRAGNKSVSLSVIRNNSAVDLYERLGFKLVGQDEIKHHMRWRIS